MKLAVIAVLFGVVPALAQLDPADVGTDTPTCETSGPEWEWTVEVPESHHMNEIVLTFEQAGQVDNTDLIAVEKGFRATVTTPGPDRLLDGWAGVFPEPAVLDLVSVCAPPESTTTVPTTVSAEVLPAAIEAAPAPVHAAQPAFTG